MSRNHKIESSEKSRLVHKSAPLVIYQRPLNIRISFTFQKIFLNHFSTTQTTNMKSYIQLIGSGTFDVPPSIMVHFDGQHNSQRYLFNCGEGTQRFCLQNKLKVSKLKNVFLTRVNWDCFGGLPGMLLTIADAGTKEIKLYGGPNLTHAITATRGFIVRSTMSVETHEFQEDGMIFKDDNLTIHPIFINPEESNNSISSSSSQEDVNLPSKRANDFTSDIVDNSSLQFKKGILSLMFNQSHRPHNNKGPVSKKPKTYETYEENSALDIPDEVQTDQSSSPKDDKDSLAQQRRKLFPKRLPKSNPSPISIAYVCIGPEYKGKFDPAAAKALGLRPGPQYADLVKGKSVTAPDGTIVHPNQVLGPSRAGTLATYQTDNKDLQPRIIIHMLGNGVLENEKYQSWMKKFGPNTEHVIINGQYCPQRIIFNSIAESQFKLSKIDENRFRIPYYSNQPEKLLDSISNIPKATHLATPLLTFHMEPSFKIDASDLPELFDHNDENSRVVKELNENIEYLNIATQVREEVAKATPKATDFPGNDVIVTTLGTGSTLPAKYRNVSSTLLTIPNNGCILLDVGEGTFAALLRLFGPFGKSRGEGQISIEEFFDSLKCIFISHMHADHHLGVVGILSKWNELKRDSNAFIHIVGPPKLWKWLSEYSDVQDFGLSRTKFIDNRDILFSQKQNASPKKISTSLKSLKESINLKNFEAIEVIHCPFAYGICIEHLDGWKIVYSGDTRPCDNLVNVGKNATLLLHEATFENDLLEEALNKKHSTTEEALKYTNLHNNHFCRMNAQSILLTHFSQRYPKIPVFTDDHGKVGISFDFMQVSIGELYKLPKYVKALKVLYCEDSEEAKDNDDWMQE
ncbi:700_t:CDS:10 [Dentiscutata erythropus]|uniref:ribonuclease Z n=1 Tax=Dentiscutata erythropus TaxID=1348616 RepID=A0A9N8W527_9GLOM|nr:700_t:CDS:10 [Dentiscutata erythropus]